MLLAGAMLASCDNEMQLPPLDIPQASTITANTTIAELKAQVWSTERNYVTEVPARADGEATVIAGRVVSSDEAGNVYKNLIIQDETGAVTIAVNAKKLYLNFPVGQRVVFSMNDVKIGGYNNLLQIGGEGTYNNAPSMTFMEENVFNAHIQSDGIADVSRIDTIVATIAELETAKGSVEGLQKWQSQLIRLEGVSFVDAGKPFVNNGANTDRAVKDASGKTIKVRNSAYATFKDDLLPAGTGNVTGILSYYGTDWQIILNGVDGLKDFQPSQGGEEPDVPVTGGEGTKDSPYNCAQIIALNPSSTQTAVETGVWVEGYIVGSMPTNGTSTLLSGTNFSTADAATTNLVIAPTADCTDFNLCVGIQLPMGIRDALSLATKPENLGKKLAIKGDIYKYCGGPGVKNGAEYVLDGQGSATPDPGETTTFKAVTSITSGKQYVIVADGKLAQPVSGNYGFLQVVDATVTDNTVSVSTDKAFTITAVDGGYTIKQPDGRYLYMTGTYNSFNVDDPAPEGEVWTISFDGDKAIINNVAMGKTIQYSSQYSSYGAYPDVRGTYPTIYEITE